MARPTTSRSTCSQRRFDSARLRAVTWIAACACVACAQLACDERPPSTQVASSASTAAAPSSSAAASSSASIDASIVDLCRHAEEIAKRSGETPRAEDIAACPREMAALRRDDPTQYACALEHLRNADDAIHLRRWITACGDDPRRACLLLPEAAENQGKALATVMPQVDLCVDRLRALRLARGDAAYRCAMRCLTDLRKVAASDRCFTGCS